MKKYSNLLKTTKIYTEMPDGWHEIIGALTAPVGYKWITNGKSLFNKEYQQALLKVY